MGAVLMGVLMSRTFAGLVASGRVTGVYAAAARLMTLMAVLTWRMLAARRARGLLTWTSHPYPRMARCRREAECRRRGWLRVAGRHSAVRLMA